MSALLIPLVLAAGALAFANGANDNAKGVATLIGASRLPRRSAVRYATAMTFLGSAAAFPLARGLLAQIAALLLLAAPLGLSGAPSLLLIGAAMAAGGLLASRRVAGTMSHGITPMNYGQAFTANLATAALVLVASRFGLPVSTTHVSVGTLFGIGAVRGAARWRTVGVILASWVMTLPLAAALAAVLWLALSG